MPKQAGNEHSTSFLRWATFCSFIELYHTHFSCLFVIRYFGEAVLRPLACCAHGQLPLSLPPVSYPLRCGWFFWSQWCLDINGSGAWIVHIETLPRYPLFLVRPSVQWRHSQPVDEGGPVAFTGGTGSRIPKTVAIFNNKCFQNFPQLVFVWNFTAIQSSTTYFMFTFERPVYSCW